MDFLTIISIAVSIAIPAAGGLIAYGVLRREVKEHEEEIAEIKADLAEAKKTANAVENLAGAVEHMGQRFADQIKHLVDTFSLETGHTRTQLQDIKDELRNVRESATAAKAAVARRRPAA